MEGMIESLSVSECVTVIPTVPDDFFDYDSFFTNMYRTLASKVKQNHIFSCIDDDRMDLRESNLDKHRPVAFKLSKRCVVRRTVTELREHSSAALVKMKCAGLNPYKMVEMWKNYGPHVPLEHRDNILYQRPPDAVMAVVKMERGERAVFRQRIKEAKASGMREQLDRIAVESDGEEDGGATVNDGQQ